MAKKTENKDEAVKCVLDVDLNGALFRLYGNAIAKRVLDSVIRSCDRGFEDARAFDWREEIGYKRAISNMKDSFYDLGLHDIANDEAHAGAKKDVASLWSYISKGPRK